MKNLLFVVFTFLSVQAISQIVYNDYAAKDKETILFDDFLNNNNSWWVDNNSEAFGSVEGGNYILEWKGEAPIWYCIKNFNLDISMDFEVEASIKQVSGLPQNLFGLFFNKSDFSESGFVVNLNNESVIYVEKRYEGRSFIKSGGDPNPNIKVTNGYNKFTIRRVNGEFQFFVNGKFLKSGSISDFNSTQFGFQVWYHSRIAVDYFKLSYLKKASENLQVSNPAAENKVLPAKSDVDIDIPIVNKQNPNAFALIIGNEDYSSKQKGINSEMNVVFARNDAATFKEYAIKILGIPEQNITSLEDATLGEMSQGIDKMNKIIKVTEGQAEVFVYYAGHGLPDENTKEAYLIPVDVNGTNLNYAISLKSLYSKLSEYPSKRVSVFLDACFSGGARNQGLLSARGVKVKPKEQALTGNIVVFTSSSDEQSSLPYKAKGHGLFTYFLLKKIQETKGNVTYKELSDFIGKSVKLNSILINDKEQSPQTNTSIDIQNEWINWTLK